MTQMVSLVRLQGMDSEKFKRKLSEVNTRTVSRGQNGLIVKFNMAADDFKF